MIKKDEEPASFCIGRIMGCLPKNGDVGIEVEVEGNKFPKSNTASASFIPGVWRYTKDGSLRGNDNAEYVTKGPIAFSCVPKAVKDLFDMFTKYGSKLDDSNRTSVHVHLNVQKWHLDRFAAFVALYMSVENILTAWCGPHRVGNLFCLRVRDASAIVSSVKKFITSNGQSTFNESYRYAGMNCHSMCKFGSLEFRTLRGVTTPEPIIMWVGILQRIYEMSADYSDPREVVEGFSGNGALQFFERVLGPYADQIKADCNFDDQQIAESMLEGIRYAQDICYCRDWSTFKKDSTPLNPFGRTKKKTPSSTFNDAYSYSASLSATNNPYINPDNTFLIDEVPEEDYDDD